MSKLFALILCLVLGICNSKHIFVIDSVRQEVDSDLVAVVVLYRHGDRSPISSFPNDPYYDTSYWPQGYGQLLNKGISRQYSLGQWLRNRYDNFLPAEYSPNDIRVYSTDVDRALMSAEANLAGLYPPTESQIWEDGFLWEPIPVHLLATNDPILAMDGDCPKFDKLQQTVETSDFFKNIYVENADLFNNLSAYTGMTVSSVGDVSMIYSVLYVYRNHNSSYIPSWAEEIDLEKLSYLAGLKFAKVTFTDELKKLKAGPFFNYLIGYFTDVINNVTDVSKFLMLSAHDTTLANVLGGMDAFDNHPPEFASTLIWELSKNKQDEYFVNILYKRNSTDSYDELVLYNCDFNCAFNDFKTNLEKINIDSETWQKECEVSNSNRIVFSVSLLFATTVLSVLFL